MFASWDRARSARILRRSTRAFENLRGKSGLKIHLGSGGDIREGWVNIDFTFNLTPRAISGRSGPETLVINHDLRGDLSLAPRSCALVFSSHFFEHLSIADGTRLMRDCYRALEPGGRFRIVVPDFRACCEAYLRGDLLFFDLIDAPRVVPGLEPGSEAIIDFMNYLAYQHGEHKCLYDAEKLLKLLKLIGFSTVSESTFDAEIDVPSAERQRYSLYVDALK
jgi:predicted SAM-dependent methyltransferase